MNILGRMAVGGSTPGLVLALTAAVVAGCTVGVVGGGGEGGSDNPPGNTGGGGGGTAGENEVAIRFVNQSDVPVDTRFFFANQPSDDPSVDLFDVANLVQTRIGIHGILISGQEAEIIKPCSPDTIFGTEGGEFLEPDTLAHLAFGTTRIARFGESFDCGNTVIFWYVGEAGDYDSQPPIPDVRD
ncbi:MAG: hypothetical protein IID40_03740 [Planctomycetes bacterium]|nr:hypothetical protein [Planctomycetota bacterium]